MSPAPDQPGRPRYAAGDVAVLRAALAPRGEDHLLRSSSVVQDVSYAPGRLAYRTFDGDSVEVIRLGYRPLRVLAGGVPLALRSAPAGEGYSLEPLAGGDVVVRVHHSTVNYKDGLAITGKLPVVRRFPMIPGIDFCGEVVSSESPDFKPGDTVVVQVKVVEGDRERVQAYEGVVIARSNRGLNSSFTVRKISHGEGVERVFQTYSPAISDISVKRRGQVRRAKLYYLRERSGKSARIKEKLPARKAK